MRELGERVALALTWAPHREGRGGFKDGIEALDALVASSRAEVGALSAAETARDQALAALADMLKRATPGPGQSYLVPDDSIATGRAVLAAVREGAQESAGQEQSGARGEQT